MKRAVPALLLLLLSTLPAAASPPAAGDPFPEIPLPTPVLTGERRYLGVPAAPTFTLGEVSADLVLVELLNVHCPHCQMQTVPYNELFRLIEADPATAGRIKILGVAVGNVAEEVARFNRNFEVAFPILPDPRFAIYRGVGWEGSTPYALYVRIDPAGGGVVAGSHAGVELDYRRLYGELRALADADPAQLRRLGGEAARVREALAPVVSEEELEFRVRTAFIASGGTILDFAPVGLKSGRRVFTALMEKGDGERRRLFAEVTSRLSVCDICHDVHFIYVFDGDGRVLGFEPLQLTKYGNRGWDGEDVAAMRRRLLGTYLVPPPPFDPRVDAVTSATITSAIIFDSLAQGEALLGELREKGLR